jgi:hypothetical protein
MSAEIASAVAWLPERVAGAVPAPAGDERELQAFVRDEGRRLVFLLNALVRATRLYDLENQALEAPTRELQQALAGLVARLGVVSLVLVEDQAYVNDVRVRVRPAEQVVVDQLAAELLRHDSGGLTFHEALVGDALKRLALALGRSAADAASGAPALQERLRELGDVEVLGRWRFRIGQDDAPGEKRYAEVLGRAQAALRDTLSRLAARRMPNPLRVRRVVIDLVDALRERPERAALAPFAGPAEGDERHLLSVCQLALGLGRALGLSDAVLSDLGVTAMLHDVGYLTRPDPQRHALAGARLLARQRGFSEAKVQRLLGVIEHHEAYLDMDRDDAPGLFARILHIAEHYDLLVAARGPSAPRLSPPNALARMWAGRGSEYDPILLALFVQALGQHPPGTLVALSDGGVGVVVRAGGTRERFARPVVARLHPDTAVAGAGPLDLLDLHEERERITVTGVLDPREAGGGILSAAAAAIRAATETAPGRAS